ncbi:IgGFc-binding protein-like [Mixophyes fleayi]|uniref:IgGFc-binding protein-like n=1 Tax=Mixophyes fleayi TaxID=3061075 RepID=UPI003F4E2B6D
MDIKHYLCFCAFLCLRSLTLCEQPGTDFAVVFMQNFLPTLGKPSLHVVLTAFFPDTQANIWLPNGNYSKVVSLRPGTPMTVALPKKAEILHSSRWNGTVRITSNKPISVVATNRRAYTQSVVVVSPVMDWGTEYYIMTPSSGPEGTFPQMALINGPNVNLVLVSLKALVKFENTTYLPGEQLGLTLGPWESVQLQSNQSLSGSHLVSQEPVAVFAGHSCAEMHVWCNHVCLHLPPVTAWGSHFVVPPVPFQNHTNNVYILASRHTAVEVICGNNVTNTTVTPGTTVALEADATKSLLISSPGIIMVLMYANGGMYESFSLDGFYILSPVEQACVTYSIVSVPDYISGVLLVAHADSQKGLELNHKPLSELEWNSIEGTDIVSAFLPLDQETGCRFISNPGHDFGLATIGMSRFNSYAVPGICLDRVYLLCGFECPDPSLCQASKDRSTGVSLAPKTCMAWGRTHFRTIYGTYKFRSGNCSSILIASQGDDLSLLPFSVEKENNFDFTMKIKAFGLTLEIPAGEHGAVSVDGEVMYTPITLQDGSLNITRYGLSTLLMTSFGLRFIVGDQGFLHLQISSRYYASLSGVCVDQSPKEMLNSTGPGFGQPAIENEGTCNPGGLNIKPCGNTSSIAAFPSCHLMVASGPFQDCHSLLDPKPFVQSCKSDVCNNGVSCLALEAYALACGIEGVNLTGWRNISQCGLQCPYASHYESCSSCPTTCEGSDYDQNMCYEACVCNDGLPLHMGSCLVPEEFGCTWQDLSYASGAEFLSNDCRSLCRCFDSKVECSETQGCALGYRCELAVYWWMCEPLPYLSCSVYGGTHYVAFDQQTYNVQSSCESKMIGVCSQDSGLENFDIYLVNAQGEQETLYTRAVNITIYGKTVTLIQEYKGEIQVDGILVQTPYIMENQLQIYRDGLDLIILKSELGLVVMFNSFGHLDVRIPFSYLGAVCGLCVSLTNPVSSESSCNNYCQGNCSRCALEQDLYYGSQNLCGILNDSLGPFRDCHQKVNHGPYFQACLADMCHHNGSQSILCRSLSSYTAACQDATAVLHSWRNEGFCDYECTPNSHYILCGPSCPPTCSVTLPSLCVQPCREGCYCDPGYIMSSDRCVLPEECGCYSEGRYLMQEETFYDDQCQNLCSCSDGKLVCNAHSCLPEEECLVLQGVRGCFTPPISTCWVSTLYYRTFDGATFNTNSNCFHVLTRVCTATNLTDFEVHLRKAPLANGNQSEIEDVVLIVYGHTIIVSREAEAMQVDGETNNFPVNVDGKVLASKNDSVIIETDFGLVLRFDPLMLLLSIHNMSYAGNVCGLCGNAYGNISDGYTNLGTDDYFSKWLSFPPYETCGDNMEIFHSVFSQFNGSKYCELIQEAEGPFRDCHALLAPQHFYNLCLTSMNAEDASRQSICDGIQTYSSECQGIGVTVYSWKNETICISPTMSPPSSTQSTSAFNIPNASTLFPSNYTIPLAVSRPTTDAGCLVNPTKPECQPSNTTSCSFQIEDFVQLCDRMKLQLLTGECSLVLAKPCKNHSTQAFFSIALNYATQGNECAADFTMEIHGKQFVIQRSGEENSVWVNGFLMALPAYLIPHALSLRFNGSLLILESDFGLVIEYDPDGLLVILLPAAYQDNICGLCTLSNVSIADLETSANLYHGPFQCVEKVPEKLGCNISGNANGCSLFLGEESPFKNCQNIINPDSYYNSCQSHLCANDTSIICQDLQDYVSLCQSQSILIEPWRNESFCPFPCPRGEYELCTQPCSNCTEGRCSGICSEGCRCVEGFLWNGVTCVPEETCTVVENNSSMQTTLDPIRAKYLSCDPSDQPQSECLLCTVKDQNITTFGGNCSHTVSGAYDLLKCDDSTPQWLRIVLLIDSPLPVRLYIFFEQSFITINSVLDVWVNGNMVTLPLAVAPDLFLSRWMDIVSIGQPGKIDISFSSSGEFIVEVAESFSTQYSGACASGNSSVCSMDQWRADDLYYW